MENFKQALQILFFLGLLVAALLWVGNAAKQIDVQNNLMKSKMYPKHHCINGVEFLEFSRSSTVAYTSDGKIKTCSL